MSDELKLSDLNRTLVERNPERAKGMLDLANLINAMYGGSAHTHLIGDCGLAKLNMLRRSKTPRPALPRQRATDAIIERANELLVILARQFNYNAPLSLSPAIQDLGLAARNLETAVKEAQERHQDAVRQEHPDTVRLRKVEELVRADKLWYHPRQRNWWLNDENGNRAIGTFTEAIDAAMSPVSTQTKEGR